MHFLVGMIYPNGCGQSLLILYPSGCNPTQGPDCLHHDSWFIISQFTTPHQDLRGSCTAVLLILKSTNIYNAWFLQTQVRYVAVVRLHLGMELIMQGSGLVR